LRSLSILVLLLGLVGGAYLSHDRQNQQRVTNADVQASIARAYAVQQQQISAPQMAAESAAQQAATQKAQSAAATAAQVAAKAEDAHRARQPTSRSTTRTSPPNYGPIPSSCSAYTGNRAIGCALLLDAGFGLSEMPCLDHIFTHESNWRTNAENASSGSYGIPQALPASKMAVFGSDYRTNPVPQIKWGLSYIKSRYGSPCQAWTFWQAHNWY
jgi:hypothetical protein